MCLPVKPRRNLNKNISDTHTRTASSTTTTHNVERSYVWCVVFWYIEDVGLPYVLTKERLLHDGITLCYQRATSLPDVVYIIVLFLLYYYIYYYCISKMS